MIVSEAFLRGLAIFGLANGRVKLHWRFPIGRISALDDIEFRVHQRPC
jgi:hypothetical protein